MIQQNLQSKLSVLANHFGCRVEDITGSKRHRHIIKARHVLWHYLYRVMGVSSTEIGRMFGNKDHTTILHGVKKIDHYKKHETDIYNGIISIMETDSSFTSLKYKP